MLNLQTTSEQRALPKPFRQTGPCQEVAKANAAKILEEALCDTSCFVPSSGDMCCPLTGFICPSIVSCKIGVNSRQLLPQFGILKTPLRNTKHEQLAFVG